MKILVVSHSYPRRDGDVAGAFIHRLNLGLADRGHSVRVLVPADRGTRGDYDLDGITISRVAYGSAESETLAYTGDMAKSARSPRGLMALQSLVRRQARAIAAACSGDFDIVHAHWWVPGGLSAWLARAHRVPYVVTSHGTDVAILENSRLARTIARRVYGGAAAVSAVSGFLAARLGELVGVDPACITVQPMPLDVDRFDAREVGGGGIVTVGRLTRQKRIETVMRAYALLRDRGYRGPLRVIGDGSERAHLEALAQDLGLGSEIFTGSITPAEIPDHVGGSDVFAFAAVSEGLGLVAAEAFMLGTPVAAVNSGGIPDLVPNGGGGRLVALDDPEALAAAMADLLKNPVETRSLARERGLELKRILSAEAAAGTMEEMYREAVAR